MKKIMAVFLTMALAISTLTGCGTGSAGNSTGNSTGNAPAENSTASNSLLDQIMDKGKVSIAVFSDVTPLGYMDENNELTGIEVDIAKDLAEQLGVEVELVPTTNQNRIPYLLTEKVDLVIAAFSMTNERRKVVEFSDAYFRGGAVLVLNSENEKTKDITDIRNMEGMKIAVSKGTMNDELATALAGDKNEIQRYDNVSDVYMALTTGKADALVEDVALAGYTIQNDYPGLYTTGELLSVDVTGIGVRRGDQILLNWLNGYIFDLLSSGRMKTICDEYGVTYYPAHFEY